MYKPKVKNYFMPRQPFLMTINDSMKILSGQKTVPVAAL